MAAVRGALHQALALRGSRVALYDLRETIERPPAPLPSSFLAALQWSATSRASSRWPRRSRRSAEHGRGGGISSRRRFHAIVEARAR